MTSQRTNDHVKHVATISTGFSFSVTRWTKPEDTPKYGMYSTKYWRKMNTYDEIFRFLLKLRDLHNILASSTFSPNVSESTFVF